MKNVNLSVPVEVIPSEDINLEFTGQHVTKAKLKVFYIGATEDGRIFNEKFSKQLIESLPLTPVVGYYDEEKDDFTAHVEKQHLFGHVPENAEIYFEKDEETGRTYAFTDIYLFTGRQDIGSVAKKIIGKAHSLELDPKTVQYEVKKDQDGNFKSIEFIKGDFIGLSVVGDKEQPAFSGSEFFVENKELLNEEFVKAFVYFTNEIKNYNSNEGGVDTMNKFVQILNKEFTTQLNDFIKETYDERQNSVYGALQAQFNEMYPYPVQMDNDTVVFQDWYTSKFYRADYTYSEDGNISFTEEKEVKPRFLTEDEIDSTFTEKVEETVEVTEEVNNIVEEDKTSSNFTKVTEVTEIIEGTTTEEETTVETQTSEVNFTDEETEQEETNTTVEDNNDETAFTNSEKTELEEFRKEKKQIIINSFTKYLTKEDIEKFTLDIDAYTVETLEKELKIASSEFLIAKQNEIEEVIKEENPTNFSITQIIPALQTDEPNSNQALVDRFIK